jgi:hypothetical protein
MNLSLELERRSKEAFSYAFTEEFSYRLAELTAWALQHGLKNQLVNLLEQFVDELKAQSANETLVN